MIDKIIKGREHLHQVLPSLFGLGVGRLAEDGDALMHVGMDDLCKLNDSGEE